MFYGIIRLLVLAVVVICAGSARGGDGYEYRADELVCRMQPGHDIDIINQSYGTTVKRHQIQTDYYLLAVPGGHSTESLAVEIDARHDVYQCSFNYFLRAPEDLQRSQPFIDAQLEGDYETQAAAITLDLPEATLLATGSGVEVALLDGGVNFEHPEFADASFISVWDYVDGDSLASDEPGGPGSGHGTLVAGVMHLVSPGAVIHVYRVLDTTGLGVGFDVSAALLDAVDRGCRVINMSLGMNGVDPSLEEALRYARERDVTLVAAAGNDSSSRPAQFPYPASHPECIAVAALDSLGQKADFSNYGTRVDLCAPGTGIYGPYLDTTWVWWDGTSFAAPFVSGLATLALELAPEPGQVDLRALMALTAQSVDSLNPGLENLLGAGLIDPVAMLSQLANHTHGDVDLDGSIELDDVICMVNYVFKSEPVVPITTVADVTCDDNITAADIIYLVRYILVAGPPPCED